MAFNFKSEYLNVFSTLEIKRWKNGKIGKFSCENITPQHPFKCSFKEACKKEYIEFKLSKENRKVYMNSGVSIEFENHTLEKVNKNNDIGLGFIVSLLTLRCWPKINNPDDIYKQYYDMAYMHRGAQSDKMFKNDFLSQENDYYLYTKDKLFSFFDDEGSEYIKNRTREFFEYAREQGCVGEFVEDVKNEVVNNVVVDEMDIKLEKVNRIINLLNKEWTIGVKKHIPFNLIDTGIIYNSIVEFIKNDKLEIRYTIDTNKKSSQHRNFALKYCTKILFSTDENNENWRIFLSKLFNIQLNSIKKSIREANPEMDFQKAVEDIFKD